MLLDSKVGAEYEFRALRRPGNRTQKRPPPYGGGHVYLYTSQPPLTVQAVRPKREGDTNRTATSIWVRPTLIPVMLDVSCARWRDIRVVEANSALQSLVGRLAGAPDMVR